MKLINMKKIQICVLATLTLFLQGCYQDKGNYDYVDVNEAEITFSSFGNMYTATINLERGVELLQGDSLTVYPSIKSSVNEPESGYVYEWDAVSGDSPIRIGNQKDLLTVVNLSGGIYYIYLTVTNPETGLQMRSRFPMRVTGVADRGWLLLSDENGKAKLSMLPRVYDDYRPPIDLLELGLNNFLNSPANMGLDRDSLSAIYTIPDAELSGPIKILHGGMGDLFSPGRATFYILCNGGTTRINRGNYSWDPNWRLKNHFIDPSFYPEGMVAKEMILYDNSTLLFSGSDNNIYYMNPVGQIYFSQPINTLDGGVTYFKASTIIGGGSDRNATTGKYIIFNEDNRTFYEQGGYAKVCEKIDEPSGTVKISYANFPAEYELKRILCNEIPNAAQKFIYFLFKNTSSGQTHILRAVMATMAQDFWKPMNAIDIDKATLFATGGELHTNIFYAVDDKVYVYNIPDDESRVVLEKPGEVITALSFMPVESETRYSNFLTVASYNGNPGGGSFGQYVIKDHRTPLTLAEYSFGGEIFHQGLGKIVSISYK